eukprot:39741_1
MPLLHPKPVHILTHSIQSDESLCSQGFKALPLYSTTTKPPTSVISVYVATQNKASQPLLRHQGDKITAQPWHPWSPNTCHIYYQFSLFSISFSISSLSSKFQIVIT